MEKVALMTVGMMIAIVGAIIFGLLYALPVWLLWNGLMPVVFGLPSLTFWQALALSLLCSFLFKSSTPSSSSK